MNAKREERLMKTLIPAIAALALLLTSCDPAQATYMGTAYSDQPLSLMIQNASGDRLAVTVYYLGSRQTVVALESVPAATAMAPGAGSFSFPNPGKGVRRIVVEIDVPVGGRIATTINALPSINADGDARYVLDVVPPLAQGSIQPASRTAQKKVPISRKKSAVWTTLAQRRARQVAHRYGRPASGWRSSAGHGSPG